MWFRSYLQIFRIYTQKIFRELSFLSLAPSFPCFLLRFQLLWLPQTWSSDSSVQRKCRFLYGNLYALFYMPIKKGCPHAGSYKNEKTLPCILFPSASCWLLSKIFHLSISSKLSANFCLLFHFLVVCICAYLSRVYAYYPLEYRLVSAYTVIQEVYGSDYHDKFSLWVKEP